MSKGKGYDDESVSPVVRQTLQHWAYRLTEDDFEKGAARVRTHGASYIPKAQLKHIMVKNEQAEISGSRATAAANKRKRSGPKIKVEVKPERAEGGSSSRGSCSGGGGDDGRPKRRKR